MSKCLPSTPVGFVALHSNTLHFIQEDLWIQIQANTFKNWVNENLKDTGKNVENFDDDFRDGTRLVALVEKLQKRRLRHNKKPTNQHHEIENITIALDAIKEDGIKLVNIGK